MERQTETIIGSISGVRPTATAREKKNASFQSCLVSPLMTKTSGTITIMKRIISQVNRLTPAVEAGLDLLAGEAAGHVAEIGLRAGGDDDRGGRAAFDAGAEEADVRVLDGGDVRARRRGASVFSTGIDSPVRVAWMTNRSLAERSRTSPGIMSPAESFTMSPGTSCCSGISSGLAVADDRGGDADHRLELGGGRVGAGLLHEAQGHAQHHHQQHHRAGPEIAGRERKDRQHGQQDDQRVAGGDIQARSQPSCFSRADLVGAVLLQARGGLLFAQPVRGRAERRKTSALSFVAASWTTSIVR